MVRDASRILYDNLVVAFDSIELHSQFESDGAFLNVGQCHHICWFVRSAAASIVRFQLTGKCVRVCAFLLRRHRIDSEIRAG